ncbi:uncharacterized protein LOC144230171 [Crocuta crocuta]
MNIFCPSMLGLLFHWWFCHCYGFFRALSTPATPKVCEDEKEITTAEMKGGTLGSCRPYCRNKRSHHLWTRRCFIPRTWAAVSRAVGTQLFAYIAEVGVSNPRCWTWWQLDLTSHSAGHNMHPRDTTRNKAKKVDLLHWACFPLHHLGFCPRLSTNKRFHQSRSGIRLFS